MEMTSSLTSWLLWTWSVYYLLKYVLIYIPVQFVILYFLFCLDLYYLTKSAPFLYTMHYFIQSLEKTVCHVPTENSVNQISQLGHCVS